MHSIKNIINKIFIQIVKERWSNKKWYQYTWKLDQVIEISSPRKESNSLGIRKVKKAWLTAIRIQLNFKLSLNSCESSLNEKHKRPGPIGFSTKITQWWPCWLRKNQETNSGISCCQNSQGKSKRDNYMLSWSTWSR